MPCHYWMKEPDQRKCPYIGGLRCLAGCISALLVGQVFKWEERKGWRVLLEAFLRQFASGACGEGRCPVVLHILTHPFHSSDAFASEMHVWAADALGLLGAGPSPLVAMTVHNSSLHQSGMWCNTSANDTTDATII